MKKGRKFGIDIDGLLQLYLNNDIFFFICALITNWNNSLELQNQVKK